MFGACAENWCTIGYCFRQELPPRLWLLTLQLAQPFFRARANSWPRRFPSSRRERVKLVFTLAPRTCATFLLLAQRTRAAIWALAPRTGPAVLGSRAENGRSRFSRSRQELAQPFLVHASRTDAVIFVCHAESWHSRFRLSRRDLAQPCLALTPRMGAAALGAHVENGRRRFMGSHQERAGPLLALEYRSVAAVSCACAGSWRSSFCHTQIMLKCFFLWRTSPL